MVSSNNSVSTKLCRVSLILHWFVENFENYRKCGLLCKYSTKSALIILIRIFLETLTYQFLKDRIFFLGINCRCLKFLV